MEKEDILKFTNSVIILSKLFMTIEDKFLKQKLHFKISDLVSAFVEQKSIHLTLREYRFSNVNNVAKSDDIVEHSSNVAQYRHEKLINSINNLTDFLEYLAHTLKSDTTPLLVAQRNLLKFKLHILKQKKKGKPDKTSDASRLTSDVALLTSEVPRPSDVINSDVVNSAILISKPSVRTKPARLVLKSNSNKERIFDYIRKTPDTRTRDVMTEFSMLSGRTVKRSLKELTDEGFLKKRSDGAAVYYTCG